MSDPLVLLPGLQSDGSAWLPLMKDLVHAHSVFVPFGHQFDRTMAAMARTVLAQSPAQFHLAGWSMGGYIAFEMLRQAPERVRSLILISTMAGPEGAQSPPRRLEVIEQAREHGLRRYQDDNLDNCLFDRAGMAPEPLEALLDAAEKLGLRSFEEQTRAIMERADSRPLLAATTVPVLIVAGREDRIIPIAHAREMGALASHAVLHELPRCGHCPPLERPETVARLIREWLADLGQPKAQSIAARGL